jgi:hypothetical protein
MNLNERCGIDGFIIKPCPAVVQSSQVLYIIKTYIKCISNRDDLYVDFTYFVL